MAQRWARFLFGQKPPKVELAAEKTAAAFEYMASEGLHLPFLICDHAAVQEPLALFLLNNQQEEEAVAALKLSERLDMPDSQILRMSLGKAAMQIDVEPTDLPPGYVVANSSPELSYNVFQEDPLLVPNAADLIAGAHRAKSQARFNCEVLKWTVSTFLVPRLLPTKAVFSTFLRDVIVENVVLEPALCD